MNRRWNAAFRRQTAAWARVAEILERSLQAAASSDPANARRTFQAAERGESPSSVNAAFHRQFMGRVPEGRVRGNTDS